MKLIIATREADRRVDSVSRSVHLTGRSLAEQSQDVTDSKPNQTVTDAASSSAPRLAPSDTQRRPLAIDPRASRLAPRPDRVKGGRSTRFEAASTASRYADRVRCQADREGRPLRRPQTPTPRTPRAERPITSRCQVKGERSWATKPSGIEVREGVAHGRGERGYRATRSTTTGIPPDGASVTVRRTVRTA